MTTKEYREYTLYLYKTGRVEVDDEKWPFGCMEFASIQEAKDFIDKNCYYNNLRLN